MKTPFLVFDATGFVGRPSVPLPEMRRLYAQGPGQVLTDAGDAPDPARCARVAREARDAGALLVVDLEAEPTGLIGRVCDAIHAAEPCVRVGPYARFPERNYWDAVGNDPGAWVRRNAATRFDRDPATGRFDPEGPADKADFVCPSVYPFYPDLAMWEVYARKNIAEARRYQKQVYPYLYMYYHDSTPLKGQIVPRAYWRRMLDVCRELADGLVVWGGWQQPWDASAEWWLETQAFMGTL